MKILVNRVPSFNPYGQYLLYNDGTDEFDYGANQTTAILTAEQYNGVAAKNDNGQWVHGPDPRLHECGDSLLGFSIGLTYIRHIHSKAAYDYTVVTPTGIAFHGDGENNVLIVPSSWLNRRISAEAIAWICLGEDSGAEFRKMTAEQWQWVHSMDREYASAEIDEWIENYDRGDKARWDTDKWERAIAKSEQEASK